jgi:WD40 repeat protein
MLQAIGAGIGERWAELPDSETYGWRFLLHHLRGAGRDAEADALLRDYAWIRAKLRVQGAQALSDSWQPEPADPVAALVGRAIALSVPALTRSHQELPRQIFGRLGSAAAQDVTPLLEAAREDPDFAPAPRQPHLTPPGALRRVLRGHEGPVESAVFSPDGRRILTASWDRTARLWDAGTGAPVQVLRGHKGAVQSAVFSPDGRRILTASWDRTAWLWDAETGAPGPVLRGHKGEVRSAVFSPDGRRVLTASPDGTARLWDAETGAPGPVLRGHEGPVRSAVFSPDGRRILTASQDGTARLWDVETDASGPALRGHEGEVLSAVFSPDGRRILTASRDGTARVWDAETGAPGPVLRGHEDRVLTAVFSPDGRRILTASWDRTTRLWDAGTGDVFAAVELDAAVTAGACADGAFVLGDALGGVHVFDLPASNRARDRNDR